MVEADVAPSAAGCIGNACVDLLVTDATQHEILAGGAAHLTALAALVLLFVWHHRTMPTISLLIAVAATCVAAAKAESASVPAAIAALALLIASSEKFVDALVSGGASCFVCCCMKKSPAKEAPPGSHNEEKRRVTTEKAKAFPPFVFTAMHPAKAASKASQPLPTVVAGAAVEGEEAAITFCLNGEQVRLPDGNDPLMSLHDFLQSKTKLTGTKQSCAQGGCGTCTVTLARWDEVLGHERYSSVNACLLPLGTLHGAAVTTTEGLGNSQDGFHPVRSRAA